MQRTCKTCGREYERIPGRKSTGTYERCNSCLVNDRRIRLRKHIVEYLGGKCAKCGYNKCFGALHAHHLNPKDKVFEVSGAHCRSLSAIEEELDKCILLCSNCHSEIHHDCDKYNCCGE